MNIAEAAGAAILAIAVVGIGCHLTGHEFSDLSQAIIAVVAMGWDLVWQHRRQAT